MAEKNCRKAHAAMMDQLRAYGIGDERVLTAMQAVRRHVYIPERHRTMRNAYGDHPCYIGHGQTISQPYIVAHMTAKMDIQPGEKALDVGTGSGYQAAILAELGAEVYSIELVPELAEHARNTLDAEGYGRVHTKVGDAYEGWPEHAPFDAIIGAAAPVDVPEALVSQLGEGGRMILPVGRGAQQLVVLRRMGGSIQRTEDIMVRFVPMVHGKNI